MKTCRDCKASKPFSEFYHQGTRRQYDPTTHKTNSLPRYNPSCKPCARQRWRDYYKTLQPKK